MIAVEASFLAIFLRNLNARLAQGRERCIDIAEVTGSIPVSGKLK